jgi:Aspartyl protease
MSFACPIRQDARYGMPVVRVDVPLAVSGTRGIVEHPFIFDTGCEITTVSEDIASKLGLQLGGRDVGMHGLSGSATGRLVDVRFRFPRTVSGTEGLAVESTWVVTSARPGLALLGFMEVHRHFQMRTFEFDTYFIPWAALRGAQ